MRRVYERIKERERKKNEGSNLIWIEYILYIQISNMFILHVEDPRQSMQVRYNLQKEQHFFMDTNKLPPIQCITESPGNIDNSDKFPSVSQNLVFL